MSWRTCSAKAEPPGSRVRTTWMPRACRRSARSRAWVDFPAPSPPSNVMNLPLAMAPLVSVARARRLVDSRDPAEGHISKRVKAAAHDPCRGDILGSVERHLAGRVHGAGNTQLGDRFAFLDRWLQRAVVDDLRLEPLIGHGTRQPDAHPAIVPGQRQIKLISAPHARPTDDLALVEQPELAEAPEAPLQQARGLVTALRGGRLSVDECDQPPAVLFGRGHAAVSAFLSGPCLQLVGAALHLQQRVAMDEPVPAIPDFRLRKRRRELGVFLDDVLRELGEI